ncbi:MAG: pyrroline-5-carboxylate reductase dimerization domain-containing protein [Candidatus Ornithospirochaeta sp.]
MVCSPRGTTIEGVKALVDGGFASIVQDAVEATVKKSEEMTRNAK